MRIFLGVDGGGSTCRARAVDAEGRLVGEGLAGPANITTDPEGALAAILAATTAALGAWDPSQVTAALGLAGAADPEAVKALLPRLPFGKARIVTDGHISVLGALGRGDGIVAAIGTGSVFVLQRGGVQREIGGKGLILGDEASGAWIGRRLLSAALRAHDGFQPGTALLCQVLQDMGGPEAVVAFAARARPADFAALAGRVTGSADPAAQAILTEAGAECLKAVAILQSGQRLPVVCLGGLAPVFAPVLAGVCDLAEPLGTALDGALLLARSLADEDPAP